MTTPGRKPTWPNSGVHTPHELARNVRRLGRHSVSVERVVGELRRGASLQLHYGPRPIWRLSSGAFVPEEVARTVIGMPCITGVGDTLFAGELSQTYCFTGEQAQCSAVSKLVLRLGGPSAVAVGCGSHITGDAVTAWGLRNNIPWKWRSRIEAMADARGIQLNAAEQKIISLDFEP